MDPRLRMILVSLFLLCLSSTLVLADCPEVLTQPSTNMDSYLGLHPAGQRYGAGQMVPLVCGYRFERVSFRVGWGPAVGDVRSLTTGDSLFCDIRKDDNSLIASTHVLIPDASGLVYLEFDFTPQDLLLPAGDYLVTCYTRVDAAGGLSYCSTCSHDGTRYTNDDSNNPNTWLATTGDMAYTMILDADVTPVEAATWDGVKSRYR